MTCCAVRMLLEGPRRAGDALERVVCNRTGVMLWVRSVVLGAGREGWDVNCEPSCGVEQSTERIYILEQTELGNTRWVRSHL